MTQCQDEFSESKQKLDESESGQIMTVYVKILLI